MKCYIFTIHIKLNTYKWKLKMWHNALTIGLYLLNPKSFRHQLVVWFRQFSTFSFHLDSLLKIIKKCGTPNLECCGLTV